MTAFSFASDHGSSRGRLLAVDDDHSIIALIEELLTSQGYTVGTAMTAEQALSLARRERYDLALLDLSLPDRNGLALMEQLTRIDPDLPVVIFTGYGDVATAVESIKRGASDFLTKPLNMDSLLEAVHRGLAKRAAWGKHSPRSGANDRLGSLLGASEAIQRVFREIRRVGPAGGTVLIVGEIGTGKNLAAGEIHRLGHHSGDPLARVSNSAHPAVVERELFGYQKGAFPGADDSRPGLIEKAGGGTVLIEDAPAMPVRVQERLLDFLQTGEVCRIGSLVRLQAGARILSTATLRRGRGGEFHDLRPDLYYRLSGTVIAMPPLRERLEDLPLLAEFHLERACRKLGLPAHRLTGAALDKLARHDWPGNMDELGETLERSVARAGGEEIGPDDLTFERFKAAASARSDDPGGPTEEEIADALRRTGGNMSEAARLLRVSRSTLYRRLRK